MVTAALEDLGEDPSPGSSDGQLLTPRSGRPLYLQIARTVPAFYDIDTAAGTVSVNGTLIIEPAHKRCGRL